MDSKYDEEDTTGVNVALFKEVKEGLEKRSTLRYDNSVASLTCCLHNIESEKVLTFLNQCMFRMVSILLDQNPSKIGVFERTRIEDSLDLVVKILLKVLKVDLSLLDVLVRIVNKSVTFYAGSKTSWTNYPGDPHTRLNVINKFHDLNGFGLVRDIVKTSSGSGWLGSEKLHIILLALSEVDSGFASDLGTEIVDDVMSQLMGLSEDQVKKESTDHLSSMIRSLLPRKNEDRLQIYHAFWLRHTLKMMNCGSIVLKLFAWDQLHDIIREAIATRPPPNRYLVRNAGTEEVNGIYESTFQYGGTPEYVKIPSEENGKLFTLFRCTMRSKQKWWFISVADLEKPGTDKDVDYYQHKSRPDQEMEPPTLGWGLATGTRSPSEEPPPVLCRLEAIPGVDGRPINCLMDTLLRWTVENKLLDKVFGNSAHREIVSRSKNLLMLLGETDNLSPDDIHMIWKMGVENSAEEIQEEVCSLLASISLHFPDSSFDVLCGLAHDSIQSGNLEKINRVVDLVEQMNEEGVKFVRSLSPHAMSEVTTLVWDLYNTPAIDLNKSHRSVEDMLSLCLRFHRKGDQVLEYLRECSDALVGFRSMEEGAVNEARVSQVIRTLRFLLSQHTDPGLDQILSESGFHDVLLAELERFMALYGMCDCVSQDIISEIASRLSLIRSAYGMSSRIKMDRPALDAMWSLFSTPQVREQMFVFLRNAGVKQGRMESAYSITECFYVFRKMLCSDAVDWSECDDDAFQCFSVYFSGLGSRSEFDDEVRAEGINTLWNLTLRIPSDSSAKDAIALLLKTYSDMRVYAPESDSQLISRIFDELRTATSVISSGELTESRRVGVSRCTDLLSKIISKSSQSLNASRGSVHVFTPHAVRGNIFRIKVIVHYRVVAHQPSYTNVYNRRQSLDGGNMKEVVIEVHPMHSLQVLKQKINAAACTLQMRVSIDFKSTMLSGDAQPLSHFGIADGSEVTATLSQLSSVSSVYDDDDYNDVYYTNKAARSDMGTDYASTRLYNVATVENIESIMTLIEALDSCALYDLSKDLWSLLMVIPTQPNVLDRMTELFEGASADAWSSAFESKSSARVTYILQIIDSFLQPAPEIVADETNDGDRKSLFISDGGFGAVLRYFVTGGGENWSGKLSLAVALHILYFCLFDPVTGEASVELISQVQESSGAVLEKLLTVAYNAAIADESGIVQNALGMITSLLQSPSIASQLTSNPKAKNLLTAVLRSASKTVRDMAAVFAVEVGKSQPVVMQWLLVELEDISPGDQHCYEIFRAFCLLVQQIKEISSDVDLFAICDTVSRKLMQIKSREQPSDQSDRSMLLGCLELLRCLIDIDAGAVVGTELGKVLVDTFMNDFLFSMPVDGHDCSPVCDTPETRKAAFAVLAAYVSLSPDLLAETLKQLNSLTASAAIYLKSSWALQVSHDLRRPDIQFSGLKNQGCTCYLNSLIQQLFMSRSFRDVVMSSPVRNSLRSTLWHVKDEDLVGQEFLFEWYSGEWKRGQVISFDKNLKYHTVQYIGLDGIAEESVVLNIHTGRAHKETGRVKRISGTGEEPLSEREASAVGVLEQLQRTFCFMEKSKKRYFDPRPFIESCKSLNLNFNIYHQNDASEFCDQLLDRLETAMKGKCTKINTWKAMMEKVFGGKMLYQKIPKECDKFSVDRRDCGHWQSTRRETFLKAELLIRGKESIEDGLAQVIEGELMDGDNKIMCDTCNQKKDTVRRTCFGTLPNMLILHLKRFDLDFTTFETVKLNNRVAFPTNISMFKYTKEGIEAGELVGSETDLEQPALERRESKQQESEVDVGVENGTKVHDMLDYEYELQGVLVHSGIAQGGHYYSFIRDAGNPDNWYLFDDDDVSPFNPDNIPSQCFGGSYQTTIQGVSSMIEEDRSSNALMLFYNKMRPTVKTEDDEEEDKKTDITEEVAGEASELTQESCTNGYEAFDREVGESNHRHALTNYLVDPNLHEFVRNLIRSMYAITEDGVSSPEDSLEANFSHRNGLSDSKSVLTTIQSGIQFLLDVVLHCRERAGMKQWSNVLKQAFDAFPQSAAWFIRYVIGKNSSVLRDFLLTCGDAMARSTFVEIMRHAVSALCSDDLSSECLLKFIEFSNSEIIKTMNADMSVPEPLLVLLVRQVVKLLPEATSHLRTCDELFGLIRELGLFPPLCAYMVEQDVLASVCYFIMPEKVPQTVRELFSRGPSRYLGSDSKPFQSVIFEVIAALLGVPQTQKVNLLDEKANLWEPEFTEEAKAALTAIFKESSHYGGMDSRDIMAYMDRVHAIDETAPKVTALQVRSILERYDTLADNRLSLAGFLRYYADTAQYQSKAVWKYLKAFNFQNDLTRSAGPLTDPASLSPLEAPSGTLSKVKLPKLSRLCLMNINIFEVGLEAAELATVAIAQRFCTCDCDMSEMLIKLALKRLQHIVKDWTWNPAENIVLGFLKVLVKINDGLETVRVKEMISGEYGFMTAILNERSSSRRAENYSHSSYDSRPLRDRYLDFLQDLYLLPSVSDYIDSEAVEDPNFIWLKAQIGLTSVSNVSSGDVGFEGPLYEECKRSVAIVSGSGMAEIDGMYQFHSMFKNCGLFRKQGTNGKETVVYSIYRCSMDTGELRWYISIVPEHQEPGSTADIDFYFSPVSYREGSRHDNDPRPPSSNWEAVEVKYRPAPTIMCTYDGSDDSDREDSMAVTNDDEDPYNTSSLSGTPVDGPGYL